MQMSARNAFGARYVFDGRSHDRLAQRSSGLRMLLGPSPPGNMRRSIAPSAELGADPVHLMYVLEHSIRREQVPEEVEKRYLEFIKAELVPRYAEFIGHEIQKAYLESYSDYGQNLFDRYVDYADAWIEDPGLQGPRHRPDAQSRAPQPGTDQDREARGYRQPKGLPQRGRQVLAAVAGAEWRQEPVLDQL